jgi:hypothetical protein
MGAVPVVDHGRVLAGRRVRNSDMASELLLAQSWRGSVTAPLMSWKPPGCSSCVTNSPCCAARHHGPSSSPPTEPCSVPSAASCPDHAGRVSSSGRRRCCAGTDASSLVPGPTRTADHRAAHLRGPGPLAAHPGQRQPPANHSAATTVTGPPPPPARRRPHPSALTNPRTQCGSTPRNVDGGPQSCGAASLSRLRQGSECCRAPDRRVDPRVPIEMPPCRAVHAFGWATPLG